jgi:hypothetical protein
MKIGCFLISKINLKLLVVIVRLSRNLIMFVVVSTLCIALKHVKLKIKVNTDIDVPTKLSLIRNKSL